MNKFTLAGAAIIVMALGAYAVTRSSEQTDPVKETTAPAEGTAMVAVTLPDTLSPEGTMGKRAFDAVCADCHGDNAAGKMGIAPPLIHKIYEQSHHGEVELAVTAVRRRVDEPRPAVTVDEPVPGPEIAVQPGGRGAPVRRRSEASRSSRGVCLDRRGGAIARCG